MKRKTILIVGIICAVVLVTAIIFGMMLASDENGLNSEASPGTSITDSESPSATDISVPEGFEDSAEDSSADIEDDTSESSGLTVDTSEIEVSEDTSLPDDTSKAELPAKPVKPEEDTSKPQPDETSKTETPPVKVYSCGSENHNCENEEYHKGLLAREAEGCPYCGSHECISFYAVDKWGYTIYDPTICPKYDVKSDPYKYCQTCGKKVGDGRNGTCAVFVVDVDCPNCGEHVHAWECHTCK